MSRGYCCSWLILCKSHNLVPLAIHRMLLYSYEKDIKQILSGNTNHDNFFRDLFCKHSIKTWKSWPNLFKFQSMSILAYPGYQRCFLACDGELRFVGRKPTRVRPKAEGTRGGSLYKAWPKPETAHEKPLAPRVILAIRSNRRQETVSMPKYNL